MLRVRLDACVETDGSAHFNEQPFTGVAFGPSGSTAGILEAFRYENGIRVGTYEEPLLDQPNQIMLEGLDEFFDDMDQIVYNGKRFDGIVADFAGPYLKELWALERGDGGNPAQILTWNERGALTNAHRGDYGEGETGLTKVRQSVSWLESSPSSDPAHSLPYRTNIQLSRGHWGPYDRLRLLPHEGTNTQTFKLISKGEAGHHASNMVIGFDVNGRVDYLHTHGSDFFAYLREEAPRFTQVADFPRSWSEVVSSMASPRLELDLRPSDLDAVVEAAGGYGWFDSVEELVIRPDEVNRDQADQLFNAAALQSLTIKQRGGSIDPVIAAACEDLATRRPDVNVVLES